MITLPIKNGHVLLDKIDLEWAKSRRWHLGDTGYAKTYSGRPGGTPLRMHRLLLERILGRPLQPDELVDHINGDRLDNRRANLRLANRSQNSINRLPSEGCTSGFVGVCFDRSRNRFMAYVNVEHRRSYLGRFTSEAEAAWMRDQFALALHGEFARLNFDYVEAA